MQGKLITTAAAALFAASASIGYAAETDANAQMGQTWPEQAINAFFEVDDDELALLSEEDIRSNWDALPAEDQATVRADCDRFLDEDDADEVGAIEPGSTDAPNEVVERVREGEVTEADWEELCNIVADIEVLN